MSLEIGQIIDGKYRIVRMIGEGGMGAVFEGENTRIARRVAIKVLHAATAGNAEAVQRFEREAQAAGRIGSDHILEVLDLGSLPGGDRFMVMEFLDGEPLSSRIQRKGRLTAQEASPLLRQVLQGLSAAHGAGIIHRDLKPDNIYILREKMGIADYVKIIDFGISKFQPLSGDGMNMTRTGTVMGTPYYMSPEQANGSREADARSDLYSIGVILYEAVTGRVPFDAKSFNELLFKIVLSKPPSPLDVVPDLNPAFASIILKAMAREVDHRFQTAKDFAEALDRWSSSGLAVTIPPEDRAAFEQGMAVQQGMVGQQGMAGQSQMAPRGQSTAVLPLVTPAGFQSAPGTPGAGASSWAPQNSGLDPRQVPGTPSPWATSPGDDVHIPKKGMSGGAVLGIVGALIVVLGAGAAFALRGRGEAGNTAPAAAAQAGNPSPTTAVTVAAVPAAPAVPSPTIAPLPNAVLSAAPAPPAAEPVAAASVAPVAAAPKGTAPKPAVRSGSAPVRQSKPSSPSGGHGAKPAGGVDFGY